jgi:hypothetical protein
VTELFGAQMLIDGEEFLKLVVRLALDLGFATAVIHGVYYRLYHNREYVFTYFLFNVITFCLCLLLRKVPIELGFALGLFAVFGILRYRTEPIRIRDLTYLFVVIGIAILNALANYTVSVAELLLVNCVIVGLTVGLELRPTRERTLSAPFHYDRLELLAPDRAGQLIADIEVRTGFDVHHVDVIRVDLLRDAAELIVFYRDPS